MLASVDHVAMAVAGGIVRAGVALVRRVAVEIQTTRRPLMSLTRNNTIATTSRT